MWKTGKESFLAGSTYRSERIFVIHRRKTGLGLYGIRSVRGHGSSCYLAEEINSKPRGSVRHGISDPHLFLTLRF